MSINGEALREALFAGAKRGRDDNMEGLDVLSEAARNSTHRYSSSDDSYPAYQASKRTRVEQQSGAFAAARAAAAVAAEAAAAHQRDAGLSRKHVLPASSRSRAAGGHQSPSGSRLMAAVDDDSSSQVPPLPDSKSLQCTMCTKSFTRRSNLLRHFKAVHYQERKYQCSQCPKRFSRQGDLKTHKKTVHDRVRDHECDICHKRFYQSSHLSAHKKLVHGNARPMSNHPGPHRPDMDSAAQSSGAINAAAVAAAAAAAATSTRRSGRGPAMQQLPSPVGAQPHATPSSASSQPSSSSSSSSSSSASAGGTRAPGLGLPPSMVPHASSSPGQASDSYGARKEQQSVDQNQSAAAAAAAAAAAVAAAASGKPSGYPMHHGRPGAGQGSSGSLVSLPPPGLQSGPLIESGGTAALHGSAHPGAASVGGPASSSARAPAAAPRKSGKQPAQVGRYSCPECGMRFTQQGSMMRHRRSKHLKAPTLMCKDCDRSFSRKANYQRHLERVHKVSPAIAKAAAETELAEAFRRDGLPETTRGRKRKSAQARTPMQSMSAQRAAASAMATGQGQGSFGGLQASAPRLRAVGAMQSGQATMLAYQMRAFRGPGSDHQPQHLVDGIGAISYGGYQSLAGSAGMMAVSHGSTSAAQTSAAVDEAVHAYAHQQHGFASVAPGIPNPATPAQAASAAATAARAAAAAVQASSHRER